VEKAAQEAAEKADRRAAQPLRADRRGFFAGLSLGLVPFGGVGQQLLDTVDVLPHGSPRARVTRPEEAAWPQPGGSLKNRLVRACFRGCNPKNRLDRACQRRCNFKNRLRRGPAAGCDPKDRLVRGARLSFNSRSARPRPPFLNNRTAPP
jgi:hypothetical protein